MLLIQLLSSIALMATISSLQESGFTAEVFASEKEAVIAAVNKYNPVSIVEDREFIGAIYRSDEGFQYSVTVGKQRADQVSMRLAKSDLDHVVAFWHTHGNSQSKNRYFSDTDTALVEDFSKPLYLADYTGYLKVFEPEGRILSAYAADRLGLPRVRGYALGDVVRDDSNRPIRIATHLGNQIC